MSEGLLIEPSGGAVLLTIDRPDRSNALNRATWMQMLEALIDLDADPSVRAICITGSGKRAFCAGVDLKELNGDNGQVGIGSRSPMREVLRNLFEVLLECRKPTIAALNGHAVGAGLELALACDLRVASEHTMLSMPEAKRGLGANFGSVVLPRVIPRAVAMRMLYTGESMSAEEALKWGLLNEVVPAEELAEVAEKLVGTIASNAPLTLARYKELLVKGEGLPLPAALRLEVGPDPYTSEDRREGVRAFMEKRDPVWQGR